MISTKHTLVRIALHILGNFILFFVENQFPISFLWDSNFYVKLVYFYQNSFTMDGGIINYFLQCILGGNCLVVAR
jgi:hypothetical protein